MIFFVFHFLHNIRVNVFLTDDNISFIFIMFYLLAKNNYPCTHLNRATNFDLNYICVCTSGYTGIHCTDDIDECQSSPCAMPFVCYDMINGYYCDCPVDDPNCVLRSWAISLIVLAVIMTIFIIFIIAIIYKKR